MQELDYSMSKKDMTDAKIHHLLDEELCLPYKKVIFIDYTDSQNENFFFLHEQIYNFLNGHDLLVTNRPKKNFPRV